MFVTTTYPLEVVFTAMADATANNKRSFFLEGRKFSLSNHRYHLFFTQGVTCVECGLEGNIFLLEASSESEKPHLNLYRREVTTEGDERFILFTKDHIIPRSWGGGNEPENFQVMCEPCNGKKGSKFAGTSETPLILA